MKASTSLRTLVEEDIETVERVRELVAENGAEGSAFIFRRAHVNGDVAEVKGKVEGGLWVVSFSGKTGHRTKHTVHACLVFNDEGGLVECYCEDDSGRRIELTPDDAVERLAEGLPDLICERDNGE